MVPMSRPSVRLLKSYEMKNSTSQVCAPVGRKLEVLIQELLREANTIASKAEDLEISKLTVEAKTGIEKLREQVQNVE